MYKLGTNSQPSYDKLAHKSSSREEVKDACNSISRVSTADSAIDQTSLRDNLGVTTKKVN